VHDFLLLSNSLVARQSPPITSVCCGEPRGHLWVDYLSLLANGLIAFRDVGPARHEPRGDPFLTSSVSSRTKPVEEGGQRPPPHLPCDRDRIRFHGGLLGLPADSRTGGVPLKADHVVRGHVEDGVLHGRPPVRAQHLAERVPIVSCDEKERGQHLASVGALSGIDRALDERVEALVKGEGQPERHLAVTAHVEPLSGVLLLGHVGSRRYVRDMSVQGLSLLVASIMAVGDVAALDARDPRLAHRALVELDQADTPAARAVLSRFGVIVRAVPDPEVGLRVAGLTRATWDAVAAGTLTAHEDGPVAWFCMPRQERARLRRTVDRLPITERDCLYRVGAAWASASTARKYAAMADASASQTVLSLV
jgi:hypothetical protein